MAGIEDRISDLERIARSYALACAEALTDDGWDTLTTLRYYNDSDRGLGFQKPGGLGDYVQISEIHLGDTDLVTVAQRIDGLLEAGAY
jgi:hypothetical protein